MKISGIYRIESLTKPERVYVGSSVNIKTRWRKHLRELRSNNHVNQILQNHFNKYGETDFVFVIVELCFPEFLTAREQYYINKEKPHFNICGIAGTTLGFNHSEEAKKKIGKASEGNKNMAGKHHSEESKRKISEALKGKRISEETREKLSVAKKGKACKGHPHTEETKKRISESRKNRPPISEETRKKMSEARNGKAPWNKGKKGLQIAWNKGLKRSNGTSEKKLRAA